MAVVLDVPVKRDERRAAAGFTLVEMVVTLAVVAVGLALVGRLLIESQLGLARAQAELGNPLPRYVLARLRLDVEGALSVPAILPGWRSSALTLIVPGGGRVVWQRGGDDLERVVVDAAGHERARQVALRDVAELRWRPTAPDLVDVELIYRARDTSRVPQAGVARSWSPPTIERSVWIRVGLRAGGGAP